MVSASVELQKVRTSPCMCPQQGLTAVNGNNAGGHLSLQDHQSGVICEVAMRRGQMFIGQPWSAPWPVVVHHTECLFADICGAKHAKHHLCMPAQIWELHFVEWAIKAVLCGGAELLIESEIALHVNQFKLHISWRFPAIQWKGSGHQLPFWFIPLRITWQRLSPQAQDNLTSSWSRCKYGFTQGFLVNDAV